MSPLYFLALIISFAACDAKRALIEPAAVLALELDLDSDGNISAEEITSTLRLLPREEATRWVRSIRLSKTTLEPTTPEVLRQNHTEAEILPPGRLFVLIRAAFVG